MATQFVIVPRARQYWIEAIEKDGVHRLIERHATEQAALQRLQLLARQPEPTEPTDRWERYSRRVLPF